MKKKVGKTPRKAVRKKRPDAFGLIVRTLRALPEVYFSDPTAPSLTLSLLPSGIFYASVVRYEKVFGEGKNVVASAEANTVEEAIRSALSRWMDRTTHVRALRREIVDGEFVEVDE